MKIEILGSGCAKCNNLEVVVKEALNKIEGFHSVEKVDDLVKIMQYDVLNTPALVVDGVVKSSGKELSVNEVLEFLK